MGMFPYTKPTCQQGGHVLTLIDQQRVDQNALTELINSGKLADFLQASRHCLQNRSRDDLRVFYGLLPIRFRVRVDYDIDISELAKDFRQEVPTPLAHYDTTPPQAGIGIVTFELFPVTERLDNKIELVRRSIKDDGLRPADGRELLTFCKEWRVRLNNEIIVAIMPQPRWSHLAIQFGGSSNLPHLYDIGPSVTYNHTVLTVREKV